MSKKLPSDTLDQAVAVQNAWARIDERLTFRSLNAAALDMDIHGLSNVELTWSAWKTR